jgi:hypothetical protein
MHPKLSATHHSEIVLGKDCGIRPEMTVLEVIRRHRKTETVFRKYDKQAGTCICYNALFDTLGEVAERYNLGLEGLLLELEVVADSKKVNEMLRSILIQNYIKGKGVKR